MLACLQAPPPLEGILIVSFSNLISKGEGGGGSTSRPDVPSEMIASEHRPKMGSNNVSHPNSEVSV